jgi:hypothetical protein
MSPEGVGFIDDVLIIQMGWAFLNILSKFSFIFYIQRVKDNYCNRLKVRRELLGTGVKESSIQLLTACAPLACKRRRITYTQYCCYAINSHPKY